MTYSNPQMQVDFHVNCLVRGPTTMSVTSEEPNPVTEQLDSQVDTRR